jgi:hypothetical protein
MKPSGSTSWPETQDLSRSSTREKPPASKGDPKPVPEPEQKDPSHDKTPRRDPEPSSERPPLRTNSTGDSPRSRHDDHA